MALTVLVIAAGLWPTALTGWSETESTGLALRTQPFLSRSATQPLTLATSGSPLVAVTLPSASELRT
jgi:NAD(P)H-quinone oxidoreductase subunit 4